MSWPFKLAVALQEFSASVPAPAASASSNSCTNRCGCKCKCCSGYIQKYVNFDAEATASGGPVQKMVRFSTADMMLLLRVAQSCEHFWSNQYYKVDLLPDYKALGAAFEAQESAINVAQLEQIVDTITTGYRRAVAKLRDTEAHAALRPTAAAPCFPGLRCSCADCALMPWRRLQQLEAHQWLHKPSDNWHCRLCYRRYFIQHTLLSHLSRRTRRDEVGQLLENEAYKLMLSAQQQQEQAEQQERSARVEQLHVRMPKGTHLDFVSESEVRVPPAPRKRCKLTACPKCSHSYLHSYSHQLHMQRQHAMMQSTRRWQCPSCPRSFRTRRIYLKHLKSVRDACRLRVRRFKCSRCKWRFQLECSLRPHVAQAHVRNYSCLICNLPSQSRCCDRHSREEARVAVGEHMRQRRLELGHPPPPERKKPFKVVCSTCQKEFPNRFLLNIHVNRVHLKRKDFICETCGKSFWSRKEIEEHRRKVHLMADTIFCELCSLTIKEKGNYQRHCDSIRHVTNLAKSKGITLVEKPVSKGPPIYCKCCDRTLKGPSTFYHHCKTKKHKRRAAEQDQKPDHVDNVLNY